MAYRLLGHEDVDLGWEDLEQLIREGEIGPHEKVVRDGEEEPTILESRPEFQHLFPRGNPIPVKPANQLECKYCHRRLIVRAPLCPWCGKDLLTKPGEVSQYTSLTAPTFVGVHLGGHPALPIGSRTFAAADPDMFFFFRERASVDRSTWIERKSIIAVEVADETTIQTDNRYTFTRVALLGFLALAVPKVETKTHKRYVLSLGWDDRGMRQTALFQFEGPFSQTEAQAAHQFVSSMRLAHRP